ncbi:MAG: fumarylacetoacetate hydrolase family protein [Pseudomonadota bacterium]
MSEVMPSIRDVSISVHDAIVNARQMPPLSQTVSGFDLTMAHGISTELRVLRGERVVGRKIGFTNRTLWERYGVSAPMWGDMTEGSVADLDGRPVSMARFCEPRLEPEIALKLAAPVDASMDDETILEAIEWIAPAFEIVQSIFPRWKFTLADCAAANGLHGRLLLGPRVPVGAWALGLPGVVLRLSKNGELVETGYGHNVLDGPLSALRHLCAALVGAAASPLAPGEIVTTGTLTDAWVIAEGDTFSATYEESPLGTISASFIP